MKNKILELALLLNIVGVSSQAFAGPGIGCEIKKDLFAEKEFIVLEVGVEPTPSHEPPVAKVELFTKRCLHKQTSQQANTLMWTFPADEFPDLSVEGSQATVLFFILDEGEVKRFQIPMIVSHVINDEVFVTLPRVWESNLIPEGTNFDEVAKVFMGELVGGISLEVNLSNGRRWILNEFVAGSL